MQLRALAIVGLVGISAACVPTPAPEEPPPTAPPPTVAPVVAPPTTPPPAPACPAGTPAPVDNTGDPFNITINTFGDAECYRSEIQAATARWESIITQGKPQRTVPLPANYCGRTRPAATLLIDDLVIDVDITAIDGPGGILGSAGFCYADDSPFRPLYGSLRLDVADVAALRTSGGLVNTLTHEIGHILGIGTAWNWGSNANRFLTGTSGADPRFTGSDAVAAWQALGGHGDVPVEAHGGEGTRLAHWDEDALDDELMTGWLSPGPQPLSRVTIASLADLGYTVDATRADAWFVPAQSWASALQTMLKFGQPEPAEHTALFNPDGFVE